ncbi:TPA: ATP-binding protein [Legionella pneumophila]|nr:ATP-binding protein [Legionella pneumophila]HAU0941420.1 ATP-binding protein [Legionella pneumophila]HDO7873631.1 ATP-binding protein [Legionella pneumophila]HDO7940530.1 ATP-binding protein [Legionella pneumophila]HDO8157874.1 ATP-binding protein [Legionella pneumophila]
MYNEHRPSLRPRERDAIIQSLRAGVTPRTGLQHIQVGRAKEVAALIQDIERITQGGSTFRLIIGEFGSGKTFFLQLIRTIALEKGLVTIHADLSPDRRLHSTGGHARNLFAELMRNISTRTKPEGNALGSVVEKFITEARKQSEQTSQGVEQIIKDRLVHLTEMVGGYDFANVIAAYWRGYSEDNEQLKLDAIRWLRGEFTTKTDARLALGVRSIVDDANVYDYLKLMSLFVRQAGYTGLLVNIDEMVNLYKLASQKARFSNYEQILRILNDCLQGSAENIGFLLGGTPDFLYDPRKGLYSYEALHSRLATNSFANQAGVVDYSATSLNLTNLAPEELYILLRNLRHVYAGENPQKYLVPDEALSAFLAHCSKNIGDAYFKTPRNTIKAFIELLSVLEQNPEIKWEQLITQVTITKENNSDMPHIEIQDEDDGLATFNL